MRVPFDRLVMCHMIADMTDELVAIANRISVARKWIQKPDAAGEHFDICLSKCAPAIAGAAVEITQRQLVAKVMERRRTRPNIRQDARA